MTQDEARPDAFAVVLAELTAEFDAAMPGRIADLRASLDLARAGGPDAAAPLVDGLHRLAGNAGTFGHGDVSDRARDLERELDGVAEAPDGPAAGAGSPPADVAAVLDRVAAFVDDLSVRFPPA